MSKTTTRMLLWGIVMLYSQLLWANLKPVAIDTLPPQIIQSKVLSAKTTASGIRLQASGGDEYRWNTGASSATINIDAPSRPQKYSVHIKRLKTHENWVVQQTVYPSNYPATPSAQQLGCQNAGLSWNSRVCAGSPTTIQASGGLSYHWASGQTSSSITVVPTAGAIYTVTITGEGGCEDVQSTASAPMEVIAVPQATIDVSNNECSEIGAILTAGGGEAYHWAGGQTTQSIVTEETVPYSVTVSNGDGLCTDTASILVNTNFKPKISGPAQLCVGLGATLTASGGSSYLWGNGAISSSITVTPSSPGSYTYSVQVNAGACSQTVQHVLHIQASPQASIQGPTFACHNGSIILTASGTGTYQWSTGATTSSINVGPLQSTQTYSLTVKDPSTQCTSSTSKTIEVLPRPTLNDPPGTICAGQSVNLVVSGGSSYSWNVGGTTASIVHSPGSTSVYSVTVSDANQCTYVLSKTINVENPPSLSFGGGSSMCAGQSLNITAFGGSGTSYLWSYNNATTASITVSPGTTTTYTVTARSSGGCSTSAQRVIEVKAAPNGNIEGPGSICPGQSVTLTATGGNTYRWTEGNASTASITVSPTQNSNYTVSITNTEGCTVVKSQAIAVSISGRASNDGPLTCSKAAVTLQGTSDAQGASYRWKNASGASIATTASTTVNTAGVYTLEITATGGCTFSSSTEVSIDYQQPQVSASNSGVLSCTQTTVNLLGSSNAVGASYEWRNAAGTLLANTLNTPVTQAGTYTLKVTAANGCSNTATTTVSADVATPQVSIQNDGPLTCTKTSVTLSANPNNPSLQYTWRNSGGSILASNSSSVVVSVAGTYQLEAKGSNGCISTVSANITQSGNFPNISVNTPGQISCVGPNATISGSSSTPGVSYAWYNANGKLMATQPSFVTNIAGTYTLKVSSSEGCVSTASTTLVANVFGGQATTLNIGGSYTNSSMAQGELTCTKNSILLSASAQFAGYTVSPYWTNAAGQVISSYNSVTVSTPGYYYLRLYDCPLVKEVLIKENRPAPVVQIAGETQVCVGKKTTLTASGGTQYSWSTGNTTASLTTDYIYSPSTYSVTVSNGAYCSAVANVTVSNYPNPSISIAGPTSVCSGAMTTLTASGGESYKWSFNNATTASIIVNPIAASTYTVTVTSDKGCTATKSHVISSVSSIPNDFTLNNVPSSPFCGDAALNISVNNPNTNYTWSWSTGETGTSIQRTLSSTQTISVTATRNNGCTRTKAIPITVNPKPQGLINGTDPNCAGESTTLSAPPGEMYAWSTGATSSSITVQTGNNQSYSVTVSNAGGTCSTIFTKTVAVPAPLTLSHSLAGINDCIANNAEVIPIVSGGTGNISLGIISSGSLYLSPNLSGLRSGTYVLRAEDARGCLALEELSIQETPVEITNLNLSGLDDCVPGNTQMQIATKGDRLPLQYKLNGELLAGATTILPRTAGTYTIEVQDAAGCVASREDYFDDYDAVGIFEENISPVTDCTTPDGGIQLTYIGKPGTNLSDISVSPDGGTTWHQGINWVGNLPPGYYQTAARNDLTGCVAQGPVVQIEAPNCLPEAGFTQSVLHITSLTQRIALPWRVDKRPWGNADKPFSLRVYRVGDGKPHFVDPNIATATEPQEKSLAEGSASFTIEYSVDFEGSDERELVLEPNAGDYLEPGSYTFMMEGEGVKVDPFRKEIKVIVDLSGRVIVDPIDACPGIDITLTVNEGECWNWEGLNQPNQNSVTVKHVQGRIYAVNYLDNLVKKTRVFVGDEQINIPVKIDGIKDMCPGSSYNIWWYYKDKPFGDNATSTYSTDWKVEWIPHPTSKPIENFPNYRQVSPTETTTYKVIITYVPTGCNFELSHTVVVEDQFEKAGIKAKENSKILCFGEDVILDIENPQNISLNYTWTSDNGFSSYSKPPLKVKTHGKYILELNWIGKTCSKIIEFNVGSSDPCEIKEYFEKNGFYAIPIEIADRPTIVQPELRTPCQESNERVQDDANLGFTINKKEVGNLKDILEKSLSAFEFYGYTSSKALISENSNLCSCDNYLEKAEKRFNQSGLQYWSHIFEGKDCDGKDYLFIKAKMPSGKEYGSNGADFLSAGLNYALDYAPEDKRGGKFAMKLVIEGMLDNYGEPKTPEMFNTTPPQNVPEIAGAKAIEWQPACEGGKNYYPVNVVSASGQLITLPGQTIWRFDINPSIQGKITPGVLTGYATFLNYNGIDAIDAIYSFRYYQGTTYSLGYFQSGIADEALDLENGSERFFVPWIDETGYVDVETGILLKQRFLNYHDCGRSFAINRMLFKPNVSAILPGNLLIQPKGEFWNKDFKELALKVKNEALFSNQPVDFYSICPDALGPEIAEVGTNYSRLDANLYYNSAESSMMYKIVNDQGVSRWIYVRSEPGATIDGCQNNYSYYIWNCKIGLWQLIDPKDRRFQSDCQSIQSLFQAFRASIVMHDVLSTLGFVPIFGDLAILTSGLIYLAEGDLGRGRTEIFWALAGAGIEIVPVAGLGLRLVKTTGNALERGIAKILAIAKVIPCTGVSSFVENDFVAPPCFIGVNILGAERTKIFIDKLTELGFKFEDYSKTLTDFIHNNRLGDQFHNWLKEVDVKDFAVVIKTTLEDLKLPISRLEDLVEDIVSLSNPNLLKKMGQNADLVKAWEVLSASPTFRQNEVYLEQLANLVKSDMFDWAKLKSSFATALSKGEDHVRKWLELKIPKTDLEKTYQNGLNDIPSEYTPFTPEHKAQRWEQHKLEKKAAGETPNYESWSNKYDGNIDKAATSNKGLNDYYTSQGWTDPPYKKQHAWTDNIGPINTPRGEISGGRRFDIFNKDTGHAIEFKEYSEGIVYKTADIEAEAYKDAWLVSNGKISSAKWIFKDCEPSGPLKALLMELNLYP